MEEQNPPQPFLNFSGDEQKILAKRLAWSFVFVASALYTIFFAPRWLYLAVVEFFILNAATEYFRMLRARGKDINQTAGLLFAGLMPIAQYFSGQMLVFLVALLVLFVINFQRRNAQEVLPSVAATFLGIFWIGWLFSFLMDLRYVEHGSRWVFFVIFSTKMGDAAGYFVGKSVGRNRLIAHVSPRKTVEGAVAEFFAAWVVAMAAKLYFPEIPFLHLMALGIFLGVLSQIGDLVESLVKRSLEAKDSGRIPGLGGFLDVIDSLLFTVPFVYYYVTVVPGVQ